MEKSSLNLIFILILTLTFQINTTRITKTFSLSLEKNSYKNTITSNKHLRSEHTNTSRSKLVYNYKYSSYLAKIYIGTPPQEISAMIDTGSSLFFTTSIYCHQKRSCKVKNFFDHNKSKSFIPIHKKIGQLYGDGALKGVLGYDTLTINGIKIKNQKFGEMNKITDKSHLYNGVGAIIGIAYPRYDIPEGNVFENLIQQKLLARNLIGYYLNHGKGEMTFGYIDENLYNGTMNMHKIIENNRWTLRLDDMVIDGHALDICGKKGCKAVVDTGTSDITMPKKLFKKYKKYFYVEENCSGYDKLPTITFIFNGVEYTFAKEDYIKKYIIDKKDYCESGIKPFDLGDGEEIWLIGETFMEKHYTIFDRENDSIHFGFKK